MSARHQPSSFAPAHAGYIPNALTSSISFDQEVKLSLTTATRDLHGSLAELYSIFYTLDLVEKGYLRDSIKSTEYTATCSRLLAQWKTILKSQSVADAFGGLEMFKRTYGIPADYFPSATERLAIGVPATFEEPVEQDSSKSRGPAATAWAAAQTTQHFITFMDALRLNYGSKETLHPLLSEVMSSLNAITTADFEGRGKIIKWLIRLNNMKTTEEISDDEKREMSFDIEQAYTVFMKGLE